MEETHLEKPHSTNAQRFHEQWNLINSRSDGCNVPRSVNPYASDDSLAKYRTQAVESLLPSCFAERSVWKQEIYEFHDRRYRGG